MLIQGKLLRRGNMISYILLVILLSGNGCLAKLHEPSCSYLDGLENLLLKYVKNEHKLSLFGDTITAWESKLEETLTSVEVSETARNHKVDGVKTIVDELKLSMSETVLNVNQELDKVRKFLEDKDREIKQTLADDLKKHEADVEAFRESYKTPTVVFTAKYVSDKSVTDGHVIKFTTIVTNEGGGYSTSTGKFTAPYDGLYAFQATVCSDYRKSLYVHLVADETSLSTTLNYDHYATGTCTSIGGMTKLSKGSEAFVKSRNTNSAALYQDSNKWSSFSGMLVHTV